MSEKNEGKRGNLLRMGQGARNWVANSCRRRIQTCTSVKQAFDDFYRSFYTMFQEQDYEVDTTQTGPRRVSQCRFLIALQSAVQVYPRNNERY